MKAAFIPHYAASHTPSASAKVKPHPTARFGRSEDLEAFVVKKTKPGDSDFVPTPQPIIDRMLTLADIRPGMKVLEPSAGEGHLARVLRNLPKVNLDVLELNPFRQRVLKEQGFNVVGSDFLQHQGAYDRIIMNPPFSKNQAAEHVKHGFELLKPGGRLVAVIPEYYFVAKDKPKWTFRKWMHDASRGKFSSEQLPDDAFAPVNVKTRLLVVNKPQGVKATRFAARSTTPPNPFQTLPHSA